MLVTGSRKEFTDSWGEPCFQAVRILLLEIGREVGHHCPIFYLEFKAAMPLMS